ncbi:MAG: efflux RND transporter permease subunit [candidate division Zixibacteria bacterium]|nr:efflux RND transporter permease subunit [candidate division Zixibacteria bacterium]
MPNDIKAPFRWVWPEDRTITWKELVSQFDSAMQMPGWTNAWTMPIKTRIDMLSTGIRTPIGVKIFGKDLGEIERIGTELEKSLSKISGTRSVYSDRNTGGFYVDITPNRDAIARYGLTIRDVEDVIETAIGGMPIEMTVEGRERFTINVRYPRDLRDNVEKLKSVLVPLPAAGGTKKSSGMPGMGAAPAQQEYVSPLLASGDPIVDYSVFGKILAQADKMNSGSGTRGGDPFPGSMNPMTPGGMSPQMPAAPMNAGTGRSFEIPEGRPSIPLGQLADVKITSGPPMIRDENGMLVGYVYVDMDQNKRDIGGYVNEAKDVVKKEIQVPAGYYLKWTGQYELMEIMAKRMKIVIPITLILVVVLLYLNFRNFTETLIVLVSVPFALVGSIWLMYFLGYNYSTATLVGIIALVGLAAQTGIVMILYLDQAYEKRKKAGKIRDLNDIIWAHMEGTVMRVRPKLMTVGTMMIGLVPLLWATGTGADVMKRIAAPMVGGLITSAFLTLEIVPVIYTYWRLWQIKREQKQSQET